MRPGKPRKCKFETVESSVGGHEFYTSLQPSLQFYHLLLFPLLILSSHSSWVRSRSVATFDFLLTKFGTSDHESPFVIIPSVGLVGPWGRLDRRVNGNGYSSGSSSSLFPKLSATSWSYKSIGRRLTAISTPRNPPCSIPHVPLAGWQNHPVSSFLNHLAILAWRTVLKSSAPRLG